MATPADSNLLVTAAGGVLGAQTAEQDQLNLTKTQLCVPTDTDPIQFHQSVPGTGLLSFQFFMMQ